MEWMGSCNHVWRGTFQTWKFTYIGLSCPWSWVQMIHLIFFSIIHTFPTLSRIEYSRKSDFVLEPKSRTCHQTRATTLFLYSWKLNEPLDIHYLYTDLLKSSNVHFQLLPVNKLQTLWKGVPLKHFTKSLEKIDIEDDIKIICMQSFILISALLPVVWIIEVFFQIFSKCIRALALQLYSFTV